jgi:hypothetical protein
MLNINHSPVQQESAVEQMLRRMKGEFLEMPGLRLTCRQAQRLWNLDAIVCEALLAALVDVRFLVETEGVFLQRTDGAGGRLRHADRFS